MTLFKHSYRDLYLVIQTLANIAITIAMAMFADLIWLLIFSPIQIFFALCCNNTSLHHHSHWATFSSKKLNRVYECLLSIAGAASFQQYRNMHLLHHKFVNDAPPNKDPISVKAKGHNGQAQNCYAFCASWMYQTNFLWVWTSKSIKHMPLAHPRNFQKEIYSIFTFFCVLLLINFWFALWWFFVLCPIMQFINAAWHYGEHWGAHDRRGDTTQDSVGIYNWWYNKFCFNSGLHQEHHHKPGIHWTQLPSVTPMLHPNRVRTVGMHIFNLPWRSDLEKFLRIKT